jgi:protein ImuB
VSGTSAIACERPFALVHDEGGRLVLAAVDAAAEAAGLRPGLPLADGRALAPNLATAELRPGEDARALARLAAWCGRYTPWSAVDPTAGGLGGGFGAGSGGGAGILLDVTGCAGLFGGEAALLADLVTRLDRLGLAARAALADTIGAAWAVARFATEAARPWRVVAPGRARAALAPLPPAALRLPAAAVELLERFGLRHIGALAGLPPETLEPRFGPELAGRLRQALGTAPEVLSPLVPVPPLLARRVLAEPVVTAEALAHGLEALVAELCRRLEAKERGARRLELMVYRVDGGLQRLALGTSRPSRDADHLKRLFADRLAQVDPGFGVEVMTLAAPASERLTALQLALGPAVAGQGAGRRRRSGDDLAGLVDRLEARLGSGRVRRQAPRESHLPEGAVRRVPALAPGEAAPWHRGRPRPLRLFEPAEAIEAVALLPDHPPARFRWRRVRHRVVRAEGPERIAPEWWLDDRDRAGAPARDYFRVEDEAGRRYWLYRAGGRWFLHGLFG